MTDQTDNSAAERLQRIADVDYSDQGGYVELAPRDVADLRAILADNQTMRERITHLEGLAKERADEILRLCDELNAQPTAPVND